MRTSLVCADGSELPVDMAISVVDPDPGPRLVIAVIWDASDRIDIERYQRVSEDLLAFLAGASGTTEEIVPQLLAILCSTLDFELATAWRWDPDSELLLCEHAWRVDPSDFQAVFSTSIGTTVRTGEGLPGLVVRSNEPVWMSDAHECHASSPPPSHRRGRCANGVHLPDKDARAAGRGHRVAHQNPQKAKSAPIRCRRRRGCKARRVHRAARARIRAKGSSRPARALTSAPGVLAQSQSSPRWSKWFSGCGTKAG